MPTTIWENPARWPMDPAGYRFIARAVLDLGVAMFGDKWVGDEASAGLIRAKLSPSPDVPSLPENIQTWEEWRTSSAALQTWIPELNASPPRPEGMEFNALASRPPEMDQAHWAFARERVIERSLEARERVERQNAQRQAEVEAHNEVARPKLHRYWAVAQEIVTRCESGEIGSAFRLRAGGQMHLMRRDWWNTDFEVWTHRFQSGRFSAQEPFSREPSDADNCLIFLKQDDLERLVRSQRFAPTTDEGLPHLSPYLRIMLAVASKTGISLENQPKKAAIEAEITALWPSDLERSARLTSMMATLLREPESQAGRRRRGSRRSQ